MMRAVVAVAAALTVAVSVASADPDYVRDVVPLLKEYCHGCHGEQARPKGGLRLSKFETAAAAAKAVAVWKDVYDTVKAGDMPPAEKPQPSAAEKTLLLAWLESALAAPDLQGERDPGRPTLRRLTRLEYNNTVRDLLGLQTDLFMFPERLPFKKDYFDPSKSEMPAVLRVDAYEYGQKMPALLPRSGLPGDNRAEHGFTNRGDALNFSPLLLEKYLQVADDLMAVPNLATAAPGLADLLAADGRDEVKARFAAFLARAFRRPVPAATVDRYLKPFDTAKEGGMPDAEAIRLSVTAALASPDFLFMAERHDPNAGRVRPLDDYELAARLSYFLWASAPDDELLTAARAGKLQDPAELDAQARRMLRDPKVRELSESFAIQWLRLNELWAAQPDRRFKTFYSGPQGKGTLHSDLAAETLLLFETVLVEDRGVFDLIDPEFGYLNKRLITHYELGEAFADQVAAAVPPVPDGLKGSALNKAKAAAANTWLRVKWPDRTRGGVLTSGAVLTLTSLPGRTSPVKRGAWVLEAVYNRPPPEPTVVVPPLDERRTAEAGKTVRQKLEAHRADPNCAGCHARIDPPGFALENYDPVGRWRDDDDGLAVDANGRLADGTKFDGPAGFKAHLAKDRAAFARAFTEHLLSYALGRKLEHFDDPAVSEIVEAAAADGYPLSRIVTGVVRSFPFRHTRNLPPEPSK